MEVITTLTCMIPVRNMLSLLWDCFYRGLTESFVTWCNGCNAKMLELQKHGCLTPAFSQKAQSAQFQDGHPRLVSSA